MTKPSTTGTRPFSLQRRAASTTRARLGSWTAGSALRKQPTPRPCVELLHEYAAGLEVDLSFQDFEAEVADPLGFYELVLLAEGGCVALRRIDAETCEMKRLYVRPDARGGGLGRRLAEAVVAEAQARGYRRMLLDTLPTMTEARALYSKLGFVGSAAVSVQPGARHDVSRARALATSSSGQRSSTSTQARR
jgi:Acetyltransferases